MDMKIRSKRAIQVHVLRREGLDFVCKSLKQQERAKRRGEKSSSLDGDTKFDCLIVVARSVILTHNKKGTNFQPSFHDSYALVRCSLLARVDKCLINM